MPKQYSVVQCGEAFQCQASIKWSFDHDQSMAEAYGNESQLWLKNSLDINGKILPKFHNFISINEGFR